MMIPGEMTKRGSIYDASVLELAATGQGRSRKAACESLARFILEVASDNGPLDGFTVKVTDDGNATVYVTSNRPQRLLATLLRSQREQQGMSLADVAAVTGAKSRSTYAQYEQGKFDPSLSKVQALLDVVAPDLVVAIVSRRASIVTAEQLHGDEKELEALLANPSAANVTALRAKGRQLAKKAG